MNKKDIKNYILKYRNQYSQENITNQLIQAGATQNEINETYNEINNNTNQTKKTSSILGLILILIGTVIPLIGLILIIIGIVLGFKAIKNNKNDTLAIITIILGFVVIIINIFITIVAAGVLIQTASSLQSKSLDVGRQTQEKITTDIEVVQIYAADTSDGTIDNTDNISMVVRLGSGSAPLKLEDLLIKMDTRAGSQTLEYTPTTWSNVTYYVNYISGGKNPDYLSIGDLAEITFTNLNTISEDETATIKLLTKNGAIKPIELKTPLTMSQITTYLYP